MKRAFYLNNLGVHALREAKFSDALQYFQLAEEASKYQDQKDLDKHNKKSRQFHSGALGKYSPKHDSRAFGNESSRTNVYILPKINKLLVHITVYLLGTAHEDAFNDRLKDLRVHPSSNLEENRYHTKSSDVNNDRTLFIRNSERHFYQYDKPFEEVKSKSGDTFSTRQTNKYIHSKSSQISEINPKEMTNETMILDFFPWDPFAKISTNNSWSNSMNADFVSELKQEINTKKKFELWNLSKMEFEAISILNINANLVQAWKLLAIIHFLQNSWNNCLRDCKFGLKLDSSQKELYFLIVLSKWRSGKIQEAEIILKNFLEQHQSNIIQDESQKLFRIQLIVLSTDIYLHSKLHRKPKLKEHAIKLEECLQELLEGSWTSTTYKYVLLHWIERIILAIAHLLSYSGNDDISSAFTKYAASCLPSEQQFQLRIYEAMLKWFTMDQEKRNLDFVINSGEKVATERKVNFIQELNHRIAIKSLYFTAFRFESMNGASQAQLIELFEINRVDLRSIVQIQYQNDRSYESITDMIQRMNLPESNCIELWKACLLGKSPFTGLLFLRHLQNSHWKLLALAEIGEGFAFMKMVDSLSSMPSRDLLPLFLKVYVLNRSPNLTESQKSFLLQSIQYLRSISNSPCIVFEQSLYALNFHAEDIMEELLQEFEPLGSTLHSDIAFLKCRMLYRKNKAIYSKKALPLLNTLQNSFSVIILKLKIYIQLGRRDDFISTLKNLTPVTMEQFVEYHNIAVRFYLSQLSLQLAEEHYDRLKSYTEKFEKWTKHHGLKCERLLKKISRQLFYLKCKLLVLKRDTVGLNEMLPHIQRNWIEPSQSIQNLVLYDGKLLTNLRLKFLSICLESTNTVPQLINLLQSSQSIFNSISGSPNLMTEIMISLRLSLNRVKMINQFISLSSMPSSIRFPRPNAVLNLSLLLFETEKYDEIEVLIKRINIEDLFSREKNIYYQTFKLMEYTSALSRITTESQISLKDNNTSSSDIFKKLHNFLKHEFSTKVDKFLSIFSVRSLENAISLWVKSGELHSNQSHEDLTKVPTWSSVIKMLEGNLKYFPNLFTKVLGDAPNLLNQLSLPSITKLLQTSCKVLKMSQTLSKETDTSQIGIYTLSPLQSQVSLQHNINIFSSELIRRNFSVDIAVLASCSTCYSSVFEANQSFNVKMKNIFYDQTRWSLQRMHYDFLLSLKDTPDLLKSYFKLEREDQSSIKKGNKDVNFQTSSYTTFLQFLLSSYSIIDDEPFTRDINLIWKEYNQSSQYYKQHLLMLYIYNLNCHYLPRYFDLGESLRLKAFENSNDFMNWIFEEQCVFATPLSDIPMNCILGDCKMDLDDNSKINFQWILNTNTIFDSHAQVINDLYIVYGDQHVYDILKMYEQLFQMVSRDGEQECIEEMLQVLHELLLQESKAQHVMLILSKYKSQNHFAMECVTFLKSVLHYFENVGQSVTEAAEYCLRYQLKLMNSNIYTPAFQSPVAPKYTKSRSDILKIPLISTSSPILNYRVWHVLLRQNWRDLSQLEKGTIALGEMLSICLETYNKTKGDTTLETILLNITGKTYESIQDDPLYQFWSLTSNESPLSIVQHPFSRIFGLNHENASFLSIKAYRQCASSTIPVILTAIRQVFTEMENIHSTDESDKRSSDFFDTIQVHSSVLIIIAAAFNNLLEKSIIQWSEIPTTYCKIIAKLLLFLHRNSTLIDHFSALSDAKKYTLQLWIEIASIFNQESLMTLCHHLNVSEEIEIGLLALNSYFRNKYEESFWKIYQKDYKPLSTYISPLFQEVMKCAAEIKLDEADNVHLQLQSQVNSNFHLKYTSAQSFDKSSNTSRTMTQEQRHLLALCSIEYLFGEFSSISNYILFGKKYLFLEPPGLQISSAIVLSQTLRDSSVHSNSVIPWFDNAFSTSCYCQMYFDSTTSTIYDNKYYSCRQSILRDLAMWNVLSWFLDLNERNEKNGYICIESGHVYQKDLLCFEAREKTERHHRKEWGFLQSSSIHEYKTYIFECLEIINRKWDGFISYLETQYHELENETQFMEKDSLKTSNDRMKHEWKVTMNSMHETIVGGRLSTENFDDSSIAEALLQDNSQTSIQILSTQKSEEENLKEDLLRLQMKAHYNQLAEKEKVEETGPSQDYKEALSFEQVSTFNSFHHKSDSENHTIPRKTLKDISSGRTREILFDFDHAQKRLLDKIREMHERTRDEIYELHFS